MTDIIAILLVESIVRDLAESRAPEDKTFFEVETDTFEEKGVLEAAVVFEMRISSEGTVEMLHAKRKGGGEIVDVAGGDVCS